MIRVEPSTNPSAPWAYTATCASGYIKGLPGGQPVDVVRADENGIPALTPTIWQSAMEHNYTTASPTHVDWCDMCSEYEGHVTDEHSPWDREVCLRCDEQRVGN